MRELKELIERLLEEDERCRNDDKWLTFRVMRKFTNIYIPFEDFQKIPAFASVKRLRAHIQNKERRFIPTKMEVLKRRGLAEKFVRRGLKRL